MRILITSYRPLGYGGAEISVSLLAKGLNKLGNKVIIASTEKFGGFECKLFKKFEKLPFKFHEIYLKHFLINIIKKEKIDVIYSQDRLTSIGAILAAKKCKIKTVVHFRDYWFACPYSSCLSEDGFEYNKCTSKIILKHFKAKRWLWDFYKLKYLRRARKILDKADIKIANSSAVKRRLEINNIRNSIVVPILREFKDEIGDGSRIKKKYNLRKKVITFIGSLTYPKGIMNMVKIMPNILNDNISFLIVGSGALFDKIRGDGIVKTGKLNFNEMKDIYAASDLIVLPSLWQEPLSGILLEAASFKKAILSSDRGGSIDIFEDLIKADDLNEWEKRIKELIENDDLRNKKALEWYKKAKSKYDVDIISKKINELLN